MENLILSILNSKEVQHQWTIESETQLTKATFHEEDTYHLTLYESYYVLSNPLIPYSIRKSRS